MFIWHVSVELVMLRNKDELQTDTVAMTGQLPPRGQLRACSLWLAQAGLSGLIRATRHRSCHHHCPPFAILSPHLGEGQEMATNPLTPSRIQDGAQLADCEVPASLLVGEVRPPQPPGPRACPTLPLFTRGCNPHVCLHFRSAHREMPSMVTCCVLPEPPFLQGATPRCWGHPLGLCFLRCTSSLFPLILGVSTLSICAVAPVKPTEPGTRTASRSCDLPSLMPGWHITQTNPVQVFRFTSYPQLLSSYDINAQVPPDTRPLDVDQEEALKAVVRGSTPGHHPSREGCVTELTGDTHGSPVLTQIRHEVLTSAILTVHDQTLASVTNAAAAVPHGGKRGHHKDGPCWSSSRPGRPV